MDLKAIRQKLLDRLAALESVSESAREAGATVALDQARVGRLSRMDALAQQAVSQATSARRRMELDAIAKALKRIEDGCYGLCTQCDEPIAPARLDASPAVALCLGCAERREAR